MLPDASAGCNGGGVGTTAVVAGVPNLTVAISSTPSDDAIDPVTDMFNILEGSALIPFAEVCRASSINGQLQCELLSA